MGTGVRMARGRPRKRRGGATAGPGDGATARPDGGAATRPDDGATARPDGGATTGHEAELWAMADALRGSMDAAEYKHVVLGLIFLKYISDAFEERHAAVLAEWGAEAAEDRDEYTAENIFWVPPQARWGHLKAQARQPTVGKAVDDAMAAVERDNPALESVLPQDYARPALDKQRIGQLIDMIGNIRVGDADARSRDVLGRVYEYFLSRFANAEGRKGGEFYTPRCVVRLLVEMLEPYRGRVYDPCCGSSGMFVQSVEFIRAHATGNGNGGGARGDISIYGQESNYTTWRLAKMNLAIRGIEGRIAHGDSFHNDRHPDLKADFILANPPFNVSDWGGERLADDRRWRYGVPPKGNANFAWVQHMVHHLAPGGTAHEHRHDLPAALHRYAGGRLRRGRQASPDGRFHVRHLSRRLREGVRAGAGAERQAAAQAACRLLRQQPAGRSPCLQGPVPPRRPTRTDRGRRGGTLARLPRQPQRYRARLRRGLRRGHARATPRTHRRRQGAGRNDRGGTG